MSKQSAAIYQRPHAAQLARRLKEPRRFIQVVAGPRQAGKTTLVQQVTESSGLPVRYASADEPTLRGPEWIGQQWEAASLSFRRHRGVLVLDEVQKAALARAQPGGRLCGESWAQTHRHRGQERPDAWHFAGYQRVRASLQARANAAGRR